MYDGLLARRTGFRKSPEGDGGLNPGRVQRNDHEV
jgi:hypothetical protein